MVSLSVLGRCKYFSWARRRRRSQHNRRSRKL